MFRQLLVLASCMFVLALLAACGGGGGGGAIIDTTTIDTDETPTNLPSLIAGIDVLPTVHIPRGNSATFTVTITRAAGYDGVVTIAFKDLPYGIGSGGYNDTYFESGQTTTTITLVAQSDTPDGVFHASIVASAIGSADLVAPFDIVPGMMAHEPQTEEECAAHWLPLIGPVSGPDAVKDGWQAVSRLKDGGYSAMPDTRYQEWMIGFTVTLGRGGAINSVRERIIHVSHAGLDRDAASSTQYLMGASIHYSPGRCWLSSGFDFNLDGSSGDDRRSWTLVSHLPGGALSEQLVLESRGTELTYTKPTYEITFERVTMPTLVVIP